MRFCISEIIESQQNFHPYSGLTPLTVRRNSLQRTDVMHRFLQLFLAGFSLQISHFEQEIEVFLDDNIRFSIFKERKKNQTREKEKKKTIRSNVQKTGVN